MLGREQNLTSIKVSTQCALDNNDYDIELFP